MTKDFWRSLWIEYETPDGFIIEMSTPELDVVAWENFGPTELEQLVTRSPGQHGATLLDQLFSERLINLELKKLNCGCWGLCAGRGVTTRPATKYDLRPFGYEFPSQLDGTPDQCPGRMNPYVSIAAVTNMLRYRGGGGKLRVRFWDGTSRFCYVYPQSLPAFTESGEVGGMAKHMVMQVRLYAPNPFWFSDEEQMVGPVSVPLSVFTVQYCGTMPAYPRFVATGTLNNLTVSNTPVNPALPTQPTRVISLNYNIAFGETVTIELAPDSAGRVRKTVISDVNGDISGTVDNSSDLAEFAIVPSPIVQAGENSIGVNGFFGGIGDLGSLRMYWRDTFMGAIL